VNIIEEFALRGRTIQLKGVSDDQFNKPCTAAAQARLRLSDIDVMLVYDPQSSLGSGLEVD
jgi:hypothetical protein